MDSDGTRFRGIIWGHLLARVIERSSRQDDRHAPHVSLRTNGRTPCRVEKSAESADDDNVGAMHAPPNPAHNMWLCCG